ncbi:MAG: MBL fold metallo-hydrolase [Halieaceae bacterium]|jgi:glyoxylase-like metal-dependent hydrolase (beta-lactamase superfamily II)|nr:MBL fold metallo-hydrolase [Halieaceae bacterium]
MQQAHGEVVRLSERVQRIVAPNPGPMTGHGTNTYLIGSEAMAVLDPGPAIDSHIDAILDAVGDRLRWIVCTHTHPDHSPAAAVLAERTGAKLVGRTTEDDQHQDLTFQPDRVIEHDEVLTSEGWHLRAIRTPGHVDNHVCYLLEEEGMVFAGDHIMNGSTVVIIPPGGNMKHYIESLQKLLDYPVASIAPGHGELIPDCRAEVEKLVRHRLLREAKVVAGLERVGPASVDDLVPVVYNDVDPSLHPWAKLSLLAHLLKLQVESRASVSDEFWRLTASG